jgi:sigma-B regulation protein RsbU (phosphoserine phosphatase)
MASKTPAKRLKISTFKLNALLAITQAINENLSIDDLLKRYEAILREDLNIGKILIFKRNDEWECILNSGYDIQKNRKIEVDQDLIGIEEITFVTTSLNEALGSFDIVIPVYKNNAPLAYILIGDIDEEGEGVSPTIKHLHFVQTLSNIIIVAIENIRLFNESLRQEAIRKELELASKMQSMLIPDKTALPRNDKVWITSFYHPHMDVGGDYYDVIQLNENEVGFCIADVSGKGISAALLMSNFQANLRALFNPSISLVELVNILNERVMKSAKGEKFITLFIAKYNYETRNLEYINAGHNQPILYKTFAKEINHLSKGCVGMGMLDEIPLLQTGEVKIKERTKLLCYTDGLVELLNDEKVEMDTADIEKCITNAKNIEENINQIIREREIDDSNQVIFDDITMLGIEFY